MRSIPAVVEGAGTAGAAVRDPILRSAPDGDAARRILFISPEAPSPPTWGFAIRVHHLARELAVRHQVSLLTYGVRGDGRDWDGMERTFAAVHRVAPPEALRNRRRSQVRSLRSGSSFQAASLGSTAMQDAIDHLTARDDYDIIQVESSHMTGFEFPRDRVLVLDEHNVEYELLRRVASTDRSIVRRLYHGLEQRKVKAEELRAWRRCDGCALTSAEDEETVLRESPSTPTRVVPNAVDLDDFAPSPVPVEPDSLVFVGTMNFRPNADAVIHFVRETLPLVRRSRPSATLTVVGQNVPAAVRRLAGPTVRITGLVDDVRPFIASAAVVIAPLRVGGGTRLKVLEGLAMGKAVVSTTIGCEGLAVSDREHLRIADTPEAFAACAVELMTDAAQRELLGRAGRELVERTYSWPAAAAALDDFHSELVAIRRGSR